MCIDNIKVSVIVPIYNVEQYLAKCLESLLGQTYRNIEILAVDDGSTDSSADILREYAEKDDRIVAFFQENKGVASARNKALDAASGYYYAFVDSDDYLEPEYLNKLIDEAQAYDSDLVVSGFVIERGLKRTEICPRRKDGNIAEEWAYRLRSAGGRLYKASFWKDCGFRFVAESGSRGEDVPIAIESTYRATNLRIMDYAGYIYVQREGSAMNSKKKVPFLFPYVAFSEMYSRCKDRPGRNSQDLFYCAIAKTLAQFTYSIYLRADFEVKSYFKEYYEEIIGKDFSYMYMSWKKSRKKLSFRLS